MKLRLYLDTRHGSGPYPVRVGISKNGQTAFITLPVQLMPDQWDSKAQKPRRLPASRWPQVLNVTNFIERRRSDIENTLLQMEADGELHRLSAAQIRDRIFTAGEDGPRIMLSEAFSRVAALHDNLSTRNHYERTWRRICSTMSGADRLTPDDITVDWLRRFDRLMEHSGTPAVNARNVHMRNLRAVLNWCITEEYTQNYPFRRYRLRYSETEKRSLSSEQIRQLMNAPASGYDVEYRDIFILMFCLIGINITDLFTLTTDSLQDGRVVYRRAKTGTLYSIKAEPEILEILERYRGKRGLLTLTDRYGNARDYTQHINDGLKRLLPGEPFCRLSTYWARHSWASIAYNELGAAYDTVSAALGHKYGSRITAIYINPDRKRVDDLNRRMLDLVFNKK